ncbi:cobalt ABC transporter permease [Pseudooceanicola sp. MF1-13]|uniref:cobalt ABC transporter permease n=1 Tax=Pseudooceanicola sp. MF1-13 TaxID=3379095 RepID=UPI0038929C23
MRPGVLALMLSMAPLPALAHKVIFGVFPSGDAIEGELGFSNGDMAVGAVIEVYDTSGTKLGDATTDGDGFFLYTPQSPVAHQFRADLGAGHVAEAVMPADEVAAILGVAKIDPPAPAATAAATAPSVIVASLSDADRAEIATIVRDEMRPLRREIAAYKEKNDLQTILGGLGYIAGLFGLGFYIAARRRLAG